MGETAKGGASAANGNGRPRNGARGTAANGASASVADGGPEGQNGRRAEAQGQPRMWLQPFLLLALEQWQSHGYELIRRMSAFGFEALDRGSVYRTLRQLEKDGLVVSGWDTSKDGPARRLYTLTDAGRAYLNVWASSLRTYQSMLDQFFSLHPSSSDPSPRGRRGAA